MFAVTERRRRLLIALIIGIIALSAVGAAITDAPTGRWIAMAMAMLGTGQLLLLTTAQRGTVAHTVPPDDAVRLAHQLDEQRKITSSALAAQALNDAKVAGLSHQLRSSLNGVVGLADALLHSELDPHQRRSVTILLQAGEDMAQVIDGLRDGAHGSADQTSSHSAPLSMSERQTHAPVDRSYLPADPRVLLVDDIAVNRLICRTFLEKLGLKVDEAVNGQEAVRMACQTDYGVILMDVQMPVMDGYEATRQIRGRLGTRAPPILAVTANVLPEDKEMCEQSGMVAHLGKPLHLASLERLLARWIPLPAH